MARIKNLIPALIIIIITGVIFSPTLKNGFTNWDDDRYVTENVHIKNLSLKNIFKAFTSFYVGSYLPLTIISYSIEYKLFKLNPFPYHLTNLIFHILNSLLIFWLFQTLVQKRWIALITALLFAIHPLRVESVAWVSERKDVLYSFFYIGSLILYIYFRNRAQKKFFYLSLIFFVLSLLSKSMAVTLPLTLIIFDYFQNRKFDQGVWIEKIPFFALTGIFLIIAIFSQASAGAVSHEGAFTIIENLLVASHSIIFYLSKTIFPLKLSSIYPLPEEYLRPSSAIHLLPLIAIILIVSLIVLLARRSRKLIFGVTFFVITLLPVLQIVPVGQAIAERYTYIASVGIFYLFTELLTWFNYKKFSSSKLVRNLSIGISVILILLFSLITRQRCKVWRDSITLWSDALEKYPAIPLAYNNRGLAYFTRGNYQQALSDLNKAIEIDPGYGLAYNNRGLIYQAMGNFTQAIADYSISLEIDPSYAKAYNNRGLAYYSQGKLDSALADFDSAIEIEPNNPKAYNNRGLVYFSLKRYDQAIMDYNTALEIDPGYFKTYNNRALAYYSKGDYEQAINDYNEALKIEPNQAIIYNNRGLCYQARGDYDQAIADYNRALRCDPYLAVAYNNRGVAYLKKGDYDKARRDARIVVDLGQSPSPELKNLLTSAQK